MTKAKPTLAGASFALFAQYPIALVFIGFAVVVGSDSISEGLEFIGFYFFMVTVVALPIIVVLGIPIFYWMRGRKIDSRRNMLIAGGSIALVLASALTWPGYLGEGTSTGQTYYGNYRQMVVNGSPTVWGLIRFAEDLVMFTIHGALGALFFRIGWSKFAEKKT